MSKHSVARPIQDRGKFVVTHSPSLAETAPRQKPALLWGLYEFLLRAEKRKMPSEQSIKPLWKVVRSNVKFEPSVTQDEDLRTILTGLGGIAEGLGSLRTHKGSAHGRSKVRYKLKPRHARLAAHAAFTVATFVLEAWGERDT
jgi:hypothetical protein